jgi:hypothetical protein
MDRVRFITHKGKQVLLIDYHDLADEAEILEVVEERKRVVTSQPKNSLLTVGDISGTTINKNALTKIKEANVYDVPYVRRAALVGVTEHQMTAVKAVETFAHRDHHLFATLQEALDWIVSE